MTLKSKYRKVLQTNNPRKQAGIAISTFDKIDIELKLIQGDEKRYFILNKGTTNQG